MVKVATSALELEHSFGRKANTVWYGFSIAYPSAAVCLSSSFRRNAAIWNQFPAVEPSVGVNTFHQGAQSTDPLHQQQRPMQERQTADRLL